mmetsp:Transcript_25356/g.74448  ORF Transcript_25356/g.74448 Transcript_25356/m.74448 type:complete len:281 (-) Transcript_25356:557-1399(-)
MELCSPTRRACSLGSECIPGPPRALVLDDPVLVAVLEVLLGGLQLVQRLQDVVDDVLRVLHARGEADETVLDAVHLALVWGHVPVGDDGGLLDERVAAAEARGDVREFGGVAEHGAGVQPALHLEGDDAAEARGLLHGKGVVRVVRESGVDGLFDLGVFAQHVGEGLGGFVLLGDAQVQRLEAPEHEVGGVGVKDAAEHAPEVPDLLYMLLAAGEDTRNHVVVAPEVLCGGVDHDVRAQVERPLVVRCAKGAVDAHDGSRLLADGRGRGDVDAPQGRVGG